MHSKLFFLHLTGASLLCAAASSCAQQLTDFQLLAQVLGDRLLPFDQLERGSNPLVDCSWVDPDALDTDPGAVGLAQWIYTTMYSWALVSMNGGTCVFVRIPERRGLSRADAQILLSGSKAAFTREELRRGLSIKRGHTVVFADEKPNPLVETAEAPTRSRSPNPENFVEVEIGPDGTFRTVSPAMTDERHSPD